MGYYVQGRYSWNGTPIVGVVEIGLARPCWNVAKDQLPSPWSLGAPTGKDICQRESWQFYFLFHLGLSLIHPSCSFPSYSFLPRLFTSSDHPSPPVCVCPYILPRLTTSVASIPALIFFIFFFFALADTFQCFSGFLHDNPTFSLPPSSFLFPLTCRSRLYSCSPHDCTSQLSQTPEACWKAALKLSRPWRGHLSHKCVPLSFSVLFYRLVFWGAFCFSHSAIFNH